MPPAGFKRSRALWEQARESGGAGAGGGGGAGSYTGLMRAILYELQPIRMSEVTVLTDNVATYTRVYLHSLNEACRETIPRVIKNVIQFVKSMTMGQWKTVAIVLVYYGFVRWIHAKLDAGPLVLIASALVAIFTIGLSDNGSSDGLSAYSVFNKGFQKLLGSVDEDALLQQHVGGGMLGMGGVMVPPPPHGDDDDDFVAMPRGRRNQQQQRAAAAAAAGNEQNDARNHDDDDGGNNRREEPAALAPNMNRGGARRTGKKARRGENALAQRRELRAQREAAMALGFGAGVGNDDDLDQAAMLRLMDQDVLVGAEQPNDE